MLLTEQHQDEIRWGTFSQFYHKSILKFSQYFNFFWDVKINPNLCLAQVVVIDIDVQNRSDPSPKDVLRIKRDRQNHGLLYLRPYILPTENRVGDFGTISDQTTMFSLFSSMSSIRRHKYIFWEKLLGEIWAFRTFCY